MKQKKNGELDLDVLSLEFEASLGAWMSYMKVKNKYGAILKEG
jgi:hypothetical protein